MKLLSARCWGCGIILNATVGSTPEIEAEGPQPGTVSICTRCGAISVFTDDLGLRMPTEDELVDFRGELDDESIADIDACIEAIRSYASADDRRN